MIICHLKRVSKRWHLELLHSGQKCNFQDRGSAALGSHRITSVHTWSKSPMPSHCFQWPYEKLRSSSLLRILCLWLVVPSLFLSTAWWLQKSRWSCLGPEHGSIEGIFLVWNWRKDHGGFENYPSKEPEDFNSPTYSIPNKPALACAVKAFALLTSANKGFRALSSLSPKAFWISW